MGGRAGGIQSKEGARAQGGVAGEIRWGLALTCAICMHAVAVWMTGLRWHNALPCALRHILPVAHCRALPGMYSRRGKPPADAKMGCKQEEEKKERKQAC